MTGIAEWRSWRESDGRINLFRLDDWLDHGLLMTSMTRIASVSTEIIQTVLANSDFVTTYGREPTERYHVIVRVTSRAGTVGIGEACPLPFTPDEDHERIRDAIDNELGPLLIGEDPFDLETIHRKMSGVPLPGNTALAGVDIAVYDLIGKIRGSPVYEILGGQKREHVEVSAALGIGSPSFIVKSAEQKLDQGAKAIKIKVGMDVDKDIETMRAVRAAVGDSVKIRADANTGYSIKTAMRVLKEAEMLGLEYLEQPLAADDYEGLGYLRKNSSVPIMADESLQTVEDAKKLIQHEAVDFFGLKLIKHGGIYPSKVISAMAEENDIECVLISPWETQIGVAAGVHLILSSSNFNHPHETGTRELKNDPIQGLEEEMGVIQPPTGPGLGVSFQNQ
ncbi:MAG: mandelate racemase/muconate lactonizing enzyme family protein [Candidatus Thorarchaeota archaeon]